MKERERRGLEDLPEHKELIGDLVERLRALRAAEVAPCLPPSDRSCPAPWDMGITLDRRSGCWVCGQILEAFSRFFEQASISAAPPHLAIREYLFAIWCLCFLPGTCASGGIGTA